MLKNRNLVKQFCDTIQRERDRLAQFEQKLEATKPQWWELHQRVEELIARLRANDDPLIDTGPVRDAEGRLVLESGTYETFERTRIGELKAELSSVTAARDRLTQTLVAEIAVARETITRRLAFVAGEFASWTQKVIDQAVEVYRQNPAVSLVVPDDPAIADLQQAARRVGEMTDVKTMLEEVQRCTNLAEDLCLSPALFLDRILERALTL